MACMLLTAVAYAGRQYELKSPSGNLRTVIATDGQLTYSIYLGDTLILEPSPLSMTLGDGTVVGKSPRIAGVERKSVDGTVASPFYRATELPERYNEIALKLSKDWSVLFRAYDDGIAYRFVTRSKKPFTVVSETADYRFPKGSVATVPYVNRDYEHGFEPQFLNSFENQYATMPVDQLDSRRLIFLPAIVEPAKDVKICITESALENYPGMYLNNGVTTSDALTGVFAPYPKTLKQGGHNMLQMLVTEREDYIAKVDGPRGFPWRIAIVTTYDRDLAASNLSYLLGEPSRVADISWIKPGKVAWDWWNDWNLYGVDFKTGVNNDTYKAYIDFASANGIEYVILDEGWAVNRKADLMQVVPEIDLKELVDYAAKKNVGIILWAGYHAFDRDMEQVCRYFSDMGVKGFKVDFMDRDDQLITEFYPRAAETCAKYNLVLDLHGTSKPAGLNRTYPNVLNFEGVYGLENMKWAPESVDQVTYDVMIPFIRQAAGPMDYTQGAMHNASKGNYHPSNSEPMSQGTRCHQLAMYVVLDSPFNMLCDSPSNYMNEPECTGFIAEIPTVWDETRVLEGAMGQYIVTARRKGDTWYVGALNGLEPRDIEIDLSFLNPSASYTATSFSDGANAHRAGRDYRRSETPVSPASPLKVHLAPGGGFAARIAAK